MSVKSLECIGSHDNIQITFFARNLLIGLSKNNLPFNNMVWSVSKHGPNYLKGDYVENKTQGWRDPWMECLLYRHETMSSDPQQLPCVDDNVPYPQHARVETDWSWHLWLANLATLGVLGSGKTMSRKNNVKEWLRKTAWCTSGLYIGLMHPHHEHPPTHTHTYIDLIWHNQQDTFVTPICGFTFTTTTTKQFSPDNTQVRGSIPLQMPITALSCFTHACF